MYILIDGGNEVAFIWNIYEHVMPIGSNSGRHFMRSVVRIRGQELGCYRVNAVNLAGKLAKQN